MANFVYVVWKIGDQNYQGPDNDGMKHGMPISCIDPDIISYDQISDHMKKCFGITKEPISQLDNIKDMMNANMEYNSTDELAPDGYRVRSNLIDFSALSAETGISDIEDQWKSGVIVEPIDRSSQTSLLIKSSDILYPNTPDLHAITVGSYTFGTGGDYIDLASICADIGTLTGNLMFIQ